MGSLTKIITQKKKQKIKTKYLPSTETKMVTQLIQHLDLLVQNLIHLKLNYLHYQMSIQLKCPFYLVLYFGIPLNIIEMLFDMVDNQLSGYFDFPLKHHNSNLSTGDCLYLIFLIVVVQSFRTLKPVIIKKNKINKYKTNYCVCNIDLIMFN